MSLPEEELLHILDVTAAYKEKKRKKTPNTHTNSIPSDACATLIGIHLEGPFLSKEKCGAQNAKNFLFPDYEMLIKFQSHAKNLIKLCSLAPEIEGALPFIEKASPQLRISVAHTTATYETAKAAFQKGASHITHLFNARSKHSSVKQSYFTWKIRLNTS